MKGISIEQQLSRRDWIMRTAWAHAGLVVGGPRQPVYATMPTRAAICDATVSVWKQPNGRLVYLIGTAHISQVSADLAGQLVRDVRPDAVFVELDLKRVGALASVQPTHALSSATTFDQEGSNENNDNKNLISTVSPQVSSSSIIISTTPPSPEDTTSTAPADNSWSSGLKRRATQFGAAVVGSAIQGMYQNMGKAGFEPGGEFAAAVREAQAIGATVVLGDQDVDLTLRRLTQALAATDLNRLLNDKELNRKMSDLFPGEAATPMLESSVNDPNAYKDELSEFVERLKNRENVRNIMAQLQEVAPALARVMLTERDAYMAAGLNSLNQFDCIVAVMGLAHLDGVERNLMRKGWGPVALRCPAR
jgi:pheromone shutdown protein TraB